MRAVVVIQSMQDNIYFADKSRQLFDEVTYLAQRPNSEELTKLLSEYDVIIIGARENISRKMLGNATKTKIIGTLSVGTDHLNLDALSERGIHVERCPTANVRSVAEHALSLIMALAKFLKWGDQLVAEGENRSGLPSLPTEVQGKTLGLIGYGNIGTILGELASCLGMNIVATSRSRQSGSEGNVRFATLDALLAESHYVSISVPLTEETRHLINAHTLDLMMPGTILVNTSREDVVVRSDIIKALDSGKLNAYGGDYDDASLADKTLSNLAKRPNVILTPHIAGLTIEANDRLDNELIDRLANYLADR